jgi:hypothetical protein
MSKEQAETRVLEILNFVVECRGYVFNRNTPLRDIMHYQVIDAVVFLGCVADGLGVAFDQINQDLIDPETDTVATMLQKIIDSLGDDLPNFKGDE